MISAKEINQMLADAKGEKKKERTGWEVFGMFAATVMLIIGGLLCGAWSLTVLWGWFIVPTLHFAPLTMPVAVGIDLIAFNLRPPSPQPKNDDELSIIVWKGVGRILGWTSYMLLIGYIAHRFM